MPNFIEIGQTSFDKSVTSDTNLFCHGQKRLISQRARDATKNLGKKSKLSLC